MKSKNYLLALSLFLTVSYPVFGMDDQDKAAVILHQAPQKEPSIHDLPDEIMSSIFLFLRDREFFYLNDLSSIARVNKKFHTCFKTIPLSNHPLNSTLKTIVVKQEEGETKIYSTENKTVSFTLKSASPVPLDPGESLFLKYELGDRENLKTVTFKCTTKAEKGMKSLGNLILEKNSPSIHTYQWTYDNFNEGCKDFNLWIQYIYDKPLMCKNQITAMKKLEVFKIRKKDQ